MAYPDQYGTDPAARLAAELAQMRETARTAGRRAAFIFPILDADPPDDDPTNMWGFDDGRVRWRGTDGEIHEVAEAATPGAPTSGTPVQPDLSPHRHRKVYHATWGRTLCPVHGVELGETLHYGWRSSAHGHRKVMIGFNASEIFSDLAGATIRKVELSMLNQQGPPGGGGVVVRWGGHDKASEPAAYSSVRRDVFSNGWPPVGTAEFWRGGIADITWFGRAFRDDVIRGLVIDQLTSSVRHSGAMAWASVRLRITYTHTH